MLNSSMQRTAIFQMTSGIKPSGSRTVSKALFPFLTIEYCRTCPFYSRLARPNRYGQKAQCSHGTFDGNGLTLNGSKAKCYAEGEIQRHLERLISTKGV